MLPLSAESRHPGERNLTAGSDPLPTFGCSPCRPQRDPKPTYTMITQKPVPALSSNPPSLEPEYQRPPTRDSLINRA